MPAKYLSLVPQTVPQTVPQPADPSPPKRERKPAKAQHRGVQILSPRPPKEPYYRVRYVDPDTRKTVKKRIPDHVAGNAEKRTNYAKDTAGWLHRRRSELDQGGTRHELADLSIPGMFEKYRDEWGCRRSQRTQDDYRDVCDLFETWAAANGVRRVREITKGKLKSFAASRFNATDRRDKSAKDRTRAASTANRELRSLAAVINKLRAMDVVRLSSDDVKQGLERERTTVKLGEFQTVARLAEIVRACRDHDAAVYKLTRENVRDRNWDGNDTTKYLPVLPVVLFFLLTGVRRKEGLNLTARDIDRDPDVNAILVPETIAKTRRARKITMNESPLLAALVSEVKQGRMLDGWSKGLLDKTRERLIEKYNAPDFTWQGLRRTCGTFLTCAPSIYGAASPFLSAARLGHSVTIAQKHYIGVVEISATARTIEAAMQLRITPDECPRLQPAPARREKRARGHGHARA